MLATLQEIAPVLPMATVPMAVLLLYTVTDPGGVPELGGVAVPEIVSDEPEASDS
jgi:hypothetical protein